MIWLFSLHWFFFSLKNLTTKKSYLHLCTAFSSFKFDSTDLEFTKAYKCQLMSHIDAGIAPFAQCSFTFSIVQFWSRHIWCIRPWSEKEHMMSSFDHCMSLLINVVRPRQALLVRILLGLLRPRLETDNYFTWSNSIPVCIRKNSSVSSGA